MNARMAELTAMIRRLEEDLEVEFARRRLELAYTLKDGKVRSDSRSLF
jgi:hypothetical protein